MLSNILVATDGSEASDRMVECLTGLGRVGTERALLTHVFNVRDVGGLYETLRGDMTPRLDAQQRVLERAGFRVAVETRLGIPFVEINAAADRFDASLVVVGSLGASMLREALLGSTAHKILEHARRPVLLVRLEITHEAGGSASVSTAIEYGAPISVILGYARQEPFSLVLMGTQGRGLVQEIFLGSVANSVARLTPLPVLFVPLRR